MDIIKFDLQNNTKPIITIPKGPQFGSKGGSLLFVFVVIILMILIYSIINAEILILIMGILILFPLLSYIVDIHGLEYDKVNRKIRDYKKFLWLKKGKWHDIDDFKSVYLVRKQIMSLNIGRTVKDFSTNIFYQIQLVDEAHKTKILLYESIHYYQILKISKFIAESTGLDFVDFVMGRKGHR